MLPRIVHKATKRLYISTYYKLYRIIKNQNLRKKLKNNDFSIISSNCLAGVIYHDLGHKFLSPTINLFIHAPCFVKLVRNLKYYMSIDIEELKNSSQYLTKPVNYPIGIINNEIEVHFLHYNSFEEAAAKWNERRKRINYSNLFLILTDQDACNYENIKEFDEVEIKNKIFFSAINYPEIKSLVWCKKYSKKGRIDSYFTELRGYEKYIDIVKWINQT